MSSNVAGKNQTQSMTLDSDDSKRDPSEKTDILVIGHTGYIGGKIVDYFSSSEHILSRYNVITLEERLDVTDALAVHSRLSDLRNTILINCTGKTGTPNVDWCDFNKIDTLNVNIVGVMNVINSCITDSSKGNYLIQVGSGCVYGHPPGSEDLHEFKEIEKPNFFGSFYSITKIVCQAIFEPDSSPESQVYKNALLLRIRMPIDWDHKSPRNLVSKLLRYNKIISLNNSVTVLDDFMEYLVKILDYNDKNKGNEIYGILNAVNPGVYEHKQLLDLYLKLSGDKVKNFEYIKTLEDFNKLGLTKAGRSNCLLDSERCDKYGITMPPISESLPGVIKKYVDGMKAEQRAQQGGQGGQETVDVD